MSIRQDSETSWDRTFPVGDRNDSHDIEATKDGLLIDYDVLAWADIDAARSALGDSLHASAPTMLAALRRAVVALAHWGDYAPELEVSSIHDEVNAAIAAATGARVEQE